MTGGQVAMTTNCQWKEGTAELSCNVEIKTTQKEKEMNKAVKYV